MAAETADKYPEMILNAISALDEKDGSTKTSISSYIVANYTNIPEAHQIVLSNHLNRMKDSGELVFSKNNYSKPGPEGPPPKRGRGRPPKPKDPSAQPPPPPPPSSTAATVPTRGRGRPPKDPNAPPKPSKPAPSGRPRGRPRKIPRVADEDEVAEDEDRPPMTAGTGRPRGRPPKVKPADAAAVGAEVSVQN